MFVADLHQLPKIFVIFSTFSVGSGHVTDGDTHSVSLGPYFLLLKLKAIITQVGCAHSYPTMGSSPASARASLMWSSIRWRRGAIS